MPEKAGVPGEELNHHELILSMIILSMDPQTAVWKLIRILVTDFTTLTAMQRSADMARRYGDLTESATQHTRDQYELHRNNWYTKTLPRIVAGLKILLDFGGSVVPDTSPMGDSVDAES